MLTTLGGTTRKPRQRGWNLSFCPVPLPSPDPMLREWLSKVAQKPPSHGLFILFSDG